VTPTPTFENETTPRWALLSAGFVLLVVFLELGGSVWGDAPSTGYPKFLVPLGWPTALHALVLLAAAPATVAYQVGLHRGGVRTKPVMAALTALMFAAFSFGIATGQQWAAWH
jgi:hypothetical protein